MCSCYKCQRCFCVDCIEANFSNLAESRSIIKKSKTTWICFICEEIYSYKKLLNKYSNVVSFFSIRKLVNSIIPPTSFEQYQTITYDDDINLSVRARKHFVGLFSDTTLASTLKILGTYLIASDYIPVMYRLSHSLRSLLKKQIYIIPGLSDTIHLLPHQVVSLNYMNQIEIESLRGGIFADEPGLGKTLTMLSLIFGTAGTLPKYSKISWDQSKIETLWKSWSFEERLEKITKIFDKLDLFCRSISTDNNSLRKLKEIFEKIDMFEVISNFSLFQIKSYGNYFSCQIFISILSIS